MSDVRDCVQCGAEFERAGRTNRIRCFKCSPARITAVPASGSVSPLRPAAPFVPPTVDTYVPPPATDAPHVVGRHERIVTAELEKLGWLETVEGVLAVGLAMALDDQWLPGAQRTSMNKQLQTTIDNIRAAAPVEADAIDAYADAVRRMRENAG